MHYSTLFICLPFSSLKTQYVKYCVFFTFNRSVSAKYIFAMVPTKEKRTNLNLRHLHIKTRPPITWFIDTMRQTLKCTQGKQIFSILYHINCPPKCLLEEMNLIEANIIFVLLSYLQCRQFHGKIFI